MGAAAVAKAISIYGLVDPRTGQLRYVGKANDLASRLKSHLRDAKRRDTPVYRWIRKLLTQGVGPSIRLLEECTGDWREAERRIIAEYREAGTLLNVADGGDEPFCAAQTRADNGRKNARAVHDDPYRRRVWELKQSIGLHLRWLKKRGDPVATDKFRMRMREIAARRPDICSEWACA